MRQLITTILISAPLVVGCNTAVDVEDTPGESGQALCVDADPAASFTLDVDTSAWPIEGLDDPPGGAPDTQSISATCQIDELSFGEASLTMAMTCADDLQTDPVTVTLGQLPADFVVALQSGDQVELDYYWQSDGHHIASGEWLVLNAADGSHVVLAASEHGGFTSMSERMANLSVAVDDRICASPCGEEGYGCDEPHRLGMRVSDAEGTEVTVLDSTRDVLAGSADYDIVVASAEGWSCLNCGHRYDVLIALQP